MNVYYNSNFGCLVCPETRMGNTPMRVVIDPVTVLGSGFTAAALGEALLNALERSRTAPPVPRVDLGAGRFWQVTGIKGFAAFSRKFQCVRIDARGPVLEIVKLIRDTDGGYVEPVNQPPLKVPTGIPAAQLGGRCYPCSPPARRSPPMKLCPLRPFMAVWSLTAGPRTPSRTVEMDIPTPIRFLHWRMLPEATSHF